MKYKFILLYAILKVNGSQLRLIFSNYSSILFFFSFISFNWDILSHWYFIVGQIVPLVFINYKIIRFFFCYSISEASNIQLESSRDDDASSKSSYLSDNENCSKTNDSESEDTLSEVLQPYRYDLAGIQPSICWQCRRQSKQSEGALKQIELLPIKTDILRLQIKRYFKNFVFRLEKRDM